MPLNKRAHHSQFAATPASRTKPATKSGVSAAKVVATSEKPRSHQGMLRPARKNCSALSPACLLTSEPRISQKIKNPTMIAQSSVANCIIASQSASAAVDLCPRIDPCSHRSQQASRNCRHIMTKKSSTDCTGHLPFRRGAKQAWRKISKVRSRSGPVSQHLITVLRALRRARNPRDYETGFRSRGTGRFTDPRSPTPASCRCAVVVKKVEGKTTTTQRHDGATKNRRESWFLPPFGEFSSIAGR